MRLSRIVAAAVAMGVAVVVQAADAPPARSPVAILYSDAFLLHGTGAGHPESPARLRAAVKAIKASRLGPSLVWPAVNAASTQQIEAVHAAEYVSRVRKEISALKPGESGVLSTGDTVISPATWDAALLAAGAGVGACDEVMAGRASSAFALVRPPGHHATPSRGMGFCVFNNVAVAARHLQRKHGIGRVLIADFDVHHGNGTQDIFYEDDTAFYFSVHQKGIYPGTGGEEERGKGKGAGCTLNVPLARGAGDAEALAAFRDKLAPAMESFKPEFVLVSAGFDAHEGDPLGGLKYSDEGYGAIARELAAIADTYANGRIVFLLEGGYGLDSLARSVTRIVELLADRRPGTASEAEPSD